MARGKKKANEELLAQAYQVVSAELNLSECSTDNEKVHHIILAADALQDEICQGADEIKIDAYEHIKEAYPELGIPKPVWLELVHLRRLQRHTSLSDDFIAKTAATFEGAKNVTALRSVMLDAIKSNNVESVQVPTCDTQKQLEFESTEELSEDFIDTLNKCADIRHYLDSQLWTKMRLYGDAFCHLTKEPYSTFKHLLDLWHYRNGGWPKPTTPPRIWSTIFRFIREYDMLQQYGFDMASTWCKRHGLQTVRTLPSPTVTVFSRQGERFGKYFMAKLKDDAEPLYPQYNFKPWHHIIANDGVFFAYVWDSRTIEFTGNANDLNINDLRTDYVDSCEPLNTEDAELLALAQKHIPEAMLEVFTEPEKAQRVNIFEQRDPQQFSDAVAARKAELMQRFGNSAEAMEAIATDVLERYKAQHSNPPEPPANYDVKWHPGDQCFSDILGEGEIVGADEETGELIAKFFKYGQEFRVWMWTLEKR